MKEKNKKIILYFIEFFLLFVFFYIVIYFAQYNWYFGLLWMCYIGIFIMLIGIIFKKSDLILSQIIILLIPDLLWTIDFFYRLNTGNSLFLINNYFFGNSLLSEKLLSLQHLFTPLLAVGALALIKIKKNNKVLLISFLELSLFFLLGFIIPAEYGINCLPHQTICTSAIAPKSIPYLLIWVLSMFSATTISYFVLVSLPFLKKKNYRNPYK